MSCYVPTLNIVKLVNGNVEFYDAVTGAFIKMLSADIVRIDIVGDSVLIIQDNGSIERIHKDNVINTQILPAAAVAFVGTAADLAALLSASFFFISSGGGIVLPIDAFDVNYDNAVSGLAATDVQAAIDELAVPVQLYAKGTYNTLANIGTRSGYVNWSNTLLIYTDFNILAPVTIDAIRFRTNSAPAGQMSFTLYKANENGIPETKLVEVLFNTALPAGVQILTFADQVLEEGVYFWAIQSNSNVALWIAPKNQLEFGFNGRDDENLFLLQQYISPHVYATPTPAIATAPNNSFYVGIPTSVFFVQTRIKA